MFEDYTPAAMAQAIIDDDSSPYILLEGLSDNKFYKKYLDESNCRLRPLHGVEKVLETGYILKKRGFNGKFIAIIDADFRRINGAALSEDWILLTDYHDLEMMLINSSAWDQVLGERASTEKLAAFEKKQSLKSALLTVARKIAVLRWYNAQESWEIRFKERDGKAFSNFNKFLDKKEMTLKTDKEFFQFYLEKSQKQKLLSDVETTCASQDLSHHDELQFCNGHDVIALLYVALTQAVGSVKRLSPEDIEREFRLAYDSKDFEKTELKKELDKIGAAWGLEIVAK